MAIDAATLALLTAELAQTLTNAKIDKIHEPTRDEILLTLRTRTETYRLLLCTRSGSARVCLTNDTFENPSNPPGFCMLLRKYFIGGRLLKIEREEGDRIVYFRFCCTNLAGDPALNTLAVELMGRYANIVFVQNGIIVDALKRVDFADSSVRQVMPGLAYTLPPKPDRLDFCAEPAKWIVEKACAWHLPAEAALSKTITGIGPMAVREIVYRAFALDDPRAEDVAADQLDPDRRGALIAALEGLQREYRVGGKPTAIYMLKAQNEPPKPTDFGFFVPRQYGTAAIVKTYDTYSELLDTFYAARDHAERLRQKSRGLCKTVRNLHDRAVRKQAARLEELARSEHAEELRLCGELLQANFGAFQKGDGQITVQNYYTGEPVIIRLDPRLSPIDNAQKYFKEYKKSRTAGKMLQKLLAEGEEEIDYLKTVLYEVDAATGEQALDEIREELKNQGYLKYYKPRTKHPKPADFLRYRSTDGFDILVGRNNVQNDKLTLHTARGKDVWFHVQKAPGSHVVVMSRGKDVPNQTREEAACLAVLHSSQKGANRVAVDTTEVKNIWQANGAKPGMVLYTTYTTVIVTPRPGLEEQLRAPGN